MRDEGQARTLSRYAAAIRSSMVWRARGLSMAVGAPHLIDSSRLWVCADIAFHTHYSPAGLGACGCRFYNVDFLCGSGSSGEQLIKSGEGDALQLWIWKAISGNWSTLTDWFSRWGTNLKGYFWKWSIKRMVIQSLGGYEGWVLSMGVGARGRRSLSPLASPAGRDNDPGQERSTPPSSCFSFFSTLWIKGTTWTRCRRSFYWFKGGITRHSPHFESASPPPIPGTRGWILMRK